MLEYLPLIPFAKAAYDDWRTRTVYWSDLGLIWLMALITCGLNITMLAAGAAICLFILQRYSPKNTFGLADVATLPIFICYSMFMEKTAILSIAALAGIIIIHKLEEKSLNDIPLVAYEFMALIISLIV